MRRRYATTRLISEASCVIHETVSVLYEQAHGVDICTVGTDAAARRVALGRTRTASSRLEFVRFPSGFLSAISTLMMSGGQGFRHTRLVPDTDRFSHTPPALMPEASQNLR